MAQGQNMAVIEAKIRPLWCQNSSVVRFEISRMYRETFGPGSVRTDRWFLVRERIPKTYADFYCGPAFACWCLHLSACALRVKAAYLVVM